MMRSGRTWLGKHTKERGNYMEILISVLLGFIIGDVIRPNDYWMFLSSQGAWEKKK